MMNDSQKFIHENQEFEVRIAQIGEKYIVKVFLKNNQVSPEYSVSLETHGDYFSYHKESLVEQLVELAKSDIEKGLYYKA